MDEGMEKLDGAWKITCKVLLGSEVGRLFDFRDYLTQYVEPLERRKSSISGKEVVVSSKGILPNSRVIANSEVEQYGKWLANQKFDINSIKDFDSIVQAASERVSYSGNIVLGNSSNVINSHRCLNTHYAYECQDVYDGKYVAYTTSIRSPEYSFGCCIGGDIKFCIKMHNPYLQSRCMETFQINVATDCYFSACLEDCTNCMFSFNQRNKNYLIGNVQLTKERYIELKTKLTADIADTLRQKKSVPSIIDIIRDGSKFRGE